MNLLAWRKSKGLTQVEAARVIGAIIGRALIPAVLSRWERRDRAPRRADAEKIVAGLKGAVRLEDLTKLKKPTEGEAYYGLDAGDLPTARSRSKGLAVRRGY